MTITEAQWFAPLGTCRCGKPATGELKGRSNQSFGGWCRPCAEKEIKAAKKVRDEYEALVARPRPSATED